MKSIQRLLLAGAVATALAFPSICLAAPVPGSVFTVSSNNPDITNVNVYATRGEVWLRGKDFNPGITVYYTVQTPGGSSLLLDGGNNLQAYRTVVTDGAGQFSVPLFPFAKTLNSDGEYQVKAGGSVDAMTKGDNFKVLADVTPANVAAPGDTTPPTITTAASSVTVECDGSGNSAALAAWVGSNGGATATDNVTPATNLVWTNNFTTLSDGCGATGSATVTFTVKDAAGNAATTSATFTIVDTTNPSLTGNVRDILPSEAPITFTLTGGDSCGNATVAISGVTGTAVNGAGKTVSKTVTYSTSGGSFTLLQSPGVGTTVSFTATATDECGNKTTQTYSFLVLRPANEGVGNGVDGNTPGHDNNGGNDDAGNKPGSPGAKKK